MKPPTFGTPPQPRPVLKPRILRTRGDDGTWGTWELWWHGRWRTCSSWQDAVDTLVGLQGPRRVERVHAVRCGARRGRVCDCWAGAA